MPDMPEQIARLADLEENWDSYGAAKVAPRAIELAMLLRLTLSSQSREPTVTATPDGGVGFCWDNGNWSVDLSIDADGRIEGALVVGDGDDRQG